MLNFNGVKNIALFSHIRPDGDTLGSSLALYHILRDRGFECDCFCDSPIPDALKILPGCDSVNKAPFGSYDMLISLDCADIKRLGKYAPDFVRHNNTVNIDHHMTNDHFAMVNIVQNCGSTAEIVYKEVTGLSFPIAKDAAICLYAGIITDTGNFMHSNTTAESLRISSKLVESGADTEFLARKLIKEMSVNKFELVRRCLNNIRFFNNGQISFICITMRDLSECGVPSYETEGIINYALNIQGVKIAVCITESSQNSFKVSLRSNDKIDVSRVAGRFGGGGHKQASGCVVNGVLEDVVDKLVFAASTELE